MSKILCSGSYYLIAEKVNGIEEKFFTDNSIEGRLTVTDGGLMQFHFRDNDGEMRMISKYYDSVEIAPDGVVYLSFFGEDEVIYTFSKHDFERMEEADNG